MKTPDALVLSGGGMKGCASMGAAAELHASGLLRDTKYFVGSSIGSLVAAMLATDVDIPTAFAATISTHKYTSHIDIGNIDKTFGIDSGGGLRAFIDATLGKSITFEQAFRKTGKVLAIAATDLNAQKPAYFSTHTHPKMDIGCALRMSCGVPLLFSAVEYDGRLYCDASVSDNFPIEYATTVLGAKRPLGITFASVIRPPGTPWTFDTYIASVVMSSIGTLPRTVQTDAILELDVAGMRSFDFKMPSADRVTMYEQGKEQARAFVKKLN
jgi:NTE family protein